MSIPQAVSDRLPIEAGDHLDQATFHECYKTMPSEFRAELVGGIVIVPSPLSAEHGAYHALVMTWLGTYWIATPGTQARDNATAILGETSEPQPDAALIIDPACGGQTGLSADGYATGPPELIVEIASSSASIDLHNPSCHLLEFHGILRFNEGENSITLSEEETHGRQNYSDILPV